jgi:serine-type D-Ala-D-Ala carboxypeptidase (penicillin-binding protein 5/6)
LAPVRRLASLLAVLAALVGTASAAAADLPPVEAEAVILANGATGEILYERNADRRRAIASITKLMTAIVALERSRPGERVTVGPLAPTVGESSIGLRAGERLTVRDLLAAVLIQSANDAAFALAGHAGPGGLRGFIRLMNAEARELGLGDTHFVRPDGLDTPGHYSTARDVLALARAAMRRPLIRQLVRRTGGRIAGGRELFAWNDLLGDYAGLIGVKTGHTDQAGWSQVAAARRDGTVIYAVILGSPSRAERNADLAELLDWGFDQYVRARVVEERRTYATTEIPFGDGDVVELVPARSADAVVRVGRPLTERVTAPQLVELPVRRGQELGEVRVFEGGRLVATRPLVAAEDVGEPGFTAKVGWYAGRTLAEAGDMLGGVLGAIG